MGLYISLHSIQCGKDHCVVRMPSAVYKMCFLVCGFILHFRSQETFLAITEKIHVFFYYVDIFRGFQPQLLNP